jgi:hypothetical protein
MIRGRRTEMGCRRAGAALKHFDCFRHTRHSGTKILRIVVGSADAITVLRKTGSRTFLLQRRSPVPATTFFAISRISGALLPLRGGPGTTQRR